MRVAHLDPFSGVSGDMFLGAVVDAGAGLADIIAVLDGLRLDGWALSTSEVLRGGITATKIDVAVRDDGVIRTWGNVRSLIVAAGLPEGVRQQALATFERLAAAKAHVERIDVERVHFHEIGALDAIVDVVGTLAGLHLLGVLRITSTAVATGTGMTRTTHGLLPVPAPTVVELLRDAPSMATDVASELTTPVGAALVAELVDEWTTQPAMVVTSVGYGAGARQLERPNVLRLTVGAVTGEPAAATPIVALEATVDELTADQAGAVLAALRAAGADAAWARPVLAADDRPAMEIVCTGPPGAAEKLREVLFARTGTDQIRTGTAQRWARPD